MITGILAFGITMLLAWLTGKFCDWFDNTFSRQPNNYKKSYYNLRKKHFKLSVAKSAQKTDLNTYFIYKMGKPRCLGLTCGMNLAAHAYFDLQNYKKYFKPQKKWEISKRKRCVQRIKNPPQRVLNTEKQATCCSTIYAPNKRALNTEQEAHQ